MAESNSQPTRCPCGFFGSAQTLGLCSKCYREREENRSHAMLSPSELVGRSQNGIVPSFDIQGPSSSSSSLTQTSSSSPLSSRKNEFYANSSNEKSTSQTLQPPVVLTAATNSRGASPTSPKQRVVSEICSKSLPASPPAPPPEEAGDQTTATSSRAASSDSLFLRGTKRKHEEDGDECSPQPQQKNKRRCYHCNCRLDLALQAIGRCKCDFVFCSLHRLPEQHDCGFDHKETSREEARSKMVVFKKHVGTALKRLDSDS